MYQNKSKLPLDNIIVEERKIEMDFKVTLSRLHYLIEKISQSSIGKISYDSYTAQLRIMDYRR